VPDRPINERRFTDEEVREILKKAVARAPSRALAPTEGLSLSELKEIGAEVGIDPARLEDAARLVTTNGPQGGGLNRFFGGPTILNVERRVEGTLGDADTAAVLSVIRRVMGRRGDVAEIHGLLEWSSKGESGERHVTVSERDGGTVITGSANLLSAAIVSYLPAGILGVMGTIASAVFFSETGNPAGMIAGFGLLPTLFVGVRSIVNRISRSESARLDQVTSELGKLAERAGDSEKEGRTLPPSELPALPSGEEGAQDSE